MPTEQAAVPSETTPADEAAASTPAEDESQAEAAEAAEAAPAVEEPEPIEITGVEAFAPSDVQVAEATAVPTVEAAEGIEITGVEASAASDEAVVESPAAEATVAAVDLSGLSGSAEAGAEEPLRAEAAEGTPEARDVTIRAAEVEADTLYVAGEAPAGMLVRIFADDELVGEARADSDGNWLLEAQKDIPVGEVVFRVEAEADGGDEAAASPVVEAAAPFMRLADGIVLEPVAAATHVDTGLTAADTAFAPRPTYVIIRRGDNLWRIARRNYGRGIKYKSIYAANRDRIDNPHWIFPGQVFIVPTRDRSWTTIE
jgi:nucleoid-associated protein YgaU